MNHPLPEASRRTLRSAGRRFAPAASTLALSLSLFLASGAVHAAEFGGVAFDDRAKVGASELQLNGGGLRTKVFFKVYAMALYLPEKAATAEAVLAGKGAKRIGISLLRDLSAQQFADALNEGIVKNSSEAELAALKPKVQAFTDTLLSLGEAKKGTAVTLDYTPEKGTQLLVNGSAKGGPIPGEDFNRALLRIWLGAKPAQDDLKEGLLGKK